MGVGVLSCAPSSPSPPGTGPPGADEGDARGWAAAEPSSLGRGRREGRLTHSGEDVQGQEVGAGRGRVPSCPACVGRACPGLAQPKPPTESWWDGGPCQVGGRGAQAQLSIRPFCQRALVGLLLYAGPPGSLSRSRRGSPRSQTENPGAGWEGRMWPYCAPLYTLGEPGLQRARPRCSRRDGGRAIPERRCLEPVRSGTGAQTGLAGHPPRPAQSCGPLRPTPHSWLTRVLRQAESALSHGAGLCPSPGPGAEGCAPSTTQGWVRLCPQLPRAGP